MIITLHKKLSCLLITLVLLCIITSTPEAWARKKTKDKKPTIELPGEFLPPEGAETVKQFLKKYKLKFKKKKIIQVQLSIVKQTSPNPQSIVKLFPASFDPQTVKTFWEAVLIGYRVPFSPSEKIGEIEFKFADKKKFTVFITKDYYYIKHGENDMPFKSMGLTSLIQSFTRTPEYIKPR